MFTMVMSSTTISWHEAMTSRAIAFPPPPRSCAAAGGAEVGWGLLLMMCTLGRGPGARDQ
ncbi:hypothetical protein GCM10018783_27730 [Streptomyces griseosporeus]|nr:hypothetical protein GCM10018783_27730 [Streptomyces griseosporeus]